MDECTQCLCELHMIHTGGLPTDLFYILAFFLKQYLFFGCLSFYLRSLLYFSLTNVYAVVLDRNYIDRH